MTRRLILFFDCFIVSQASFNRSIRDGLLSLDPRFHGEYWVRSQYKTYQYTSKLNITLYTLKSLSIIPFDDVIIRCKCEDIIDEQVFAVKAREYFPNASIALERSASARQYLTALSKINAADNPWIFFCPNNDHPYLAYPSYISGLIALAEEAEIIYNADVISILYSHFSESVSNRRPSLPHWAAYNNTYYSTLAQTSTGEITKAQHFLCDSIKIFRYSDLCAIFSQVENKDKRLIRLEESGLYMSTSIDEIVIHPSREVCRHYDSYMPYHEFIPMLFIPHGFFDKDTTIRYLYDDYIDNSVNVNPLNYHITTQGSSDLTCLLNELPSFWHGHISHININPHFCQLDSSKAICTEFHQLRHVYNYEEPKLHMQKSFLKLFSYFHANTENTVAVRKFTDLILPYNATLREHQLNSIVGVCVISGSIIIDEQNKIIEGNIDLITNQQKYRSIRSLYPSGSVLILAEI